jgi:hypothetical protein
MTEQRARAKTTFCLTRYPANAASRLISSSPLSCPWSREGNPHVRGATLVPPAAASKWLKRKRRAQSIDRERDDSWMGRRGSDVPCRRPANAGSDSRRVSACTCWEPCVGGRRRDAAPGPPAPRSRPAGPWLWPRRPAGPRQWGPWSACRGGRKDERVRSAHTSSASGIVEVRSSSRLHGPRTTARWRTSRLT